MKNPRISFLVNANLTLMYHKHSICMNILYYVPYLLHLPREDEKEKSPFARTLFYKKLNCSHEFSLLSYILLCFYENPNFLKYTLVRVTARNTAKRLQMYELYNSYIYNILYSKLTSQTW